MNPEIQIKPKAFHWWLMQVSYGDVNVIAKFLKAEVVNNQNPQAYELLEATGDKRYTAETFEKAAKLVKQITE